MSASNYTVKFTTQFKKDFKLAEKRGLNTELLKEIVGKLARGEALPEKIVIMRSPGIGLDTENAIFNRIGC